MKMEGGGKTEKVGTSGVSKGSLSVCAEDPPIWAGSPSHSGPRLWSWAGEPHTGGSPTALGKPRTKSSHPQQGDRSLGTISLFTLSHPHGHHINVNVNVAFPRRSP